MYVCMETIYTYICNMYTHPYRRYSCGDLVVKAGFSDGFVLRVARLKSCCGGCRPYRLSVETVTDSIVLSCFASLWHNTVQGLSHGLSAQDVSADGKKALCWVVVLARVADQRHLHSQPLPC